MEVKLPPFDVSYSDTQSLALIKDWGYNYVNPEFFWNQGHKGKGVVVFVIDTMDTTDHPDVEPFLIKEACISYVQEPNGDQNGHGTWCASRVALLAPECKIVGIKGLGGGGSGSSTNIAKAYTYSADVQLPAPYNTWRRVTTASLGSSSAMPDVEAAIKYASGKGVLHIAASGNSGYQEGKDTINWPARYDDYVLAVAAHDSNEARGNFSSVGDENDITAPGVLLDGAWKNKGFAKISGTCLSGDTYVSTLDGPVKIKDIKIGTQVYSYNEDSKECTLNTVVDHLCNGIQQTYKVKTTGSTISATDNHPFLVLGNDKNSLVWKELKDIKVSDPILVPKRIPEYNSDYITYLNAELRAIFEENEYKSKPEKAILITPELCQLIGAWYGDGHLIYDGRHGRTHSGVSIAIKQGYKQLNKNLPEKYKELAEKATGLKWTVDNGCVRIYSRYILDVFDFLTVSGKALTKVVPEFLYKLPNEYKLSFLAGIIDSDGTIGKNWANLNLELSNEELIYGIKDLFQHVGKRGGNISSRQRTNVQIEGRVLVDVKPTYTLNVSGIQSLNLPILDDHYNQFIENRKDKMSKKIAYFAGNRNKFVQNIVNNTDFTFDVIKSIEKDKEEYVYDLTIEGTHNFIANGIVVHNSMSTPHVAAATALILNKYPDIKTQAVLESTIQKAAKDLLAPGWDIFTGSGSLIMTRFTDTPAPTPQPVVTATFVYDRLLYGAQKSCKLSVTLAVTDRVGFNQAMDVLYKDILVKLSKYLIINDTTESYIVYLTKVKQDLLVSYDVKKLELNINDKIYSL